MALVSILGITVVVFLQRAGQSVDKSRLRTLKSDFGQFRESLRELIDDPLFCSEMLRGQQFPTPLANPAQGHPVVLAMPYGVAGTLTIAPGTEIGQRSVAADPSTLVGFRIQAVRLFSDGVVKGVVVLDRPANPPEFKHLYNVYEVGLGITTDSSGSISGMGDPAVNVMERPQLIPMILQVSQTTGLIHDCYAPTSVANYCRLMDMDKMVSMLPIPAVRMTGGYDTEDPWWPSPTDPSRPDLEGYAAHRCHPELCRIRHTPDSEEDLFQPDLMITAKHVRPDLLATDTDCPSPPYTKQPLDRGNAAPYDAEASVCIWCNRNNTLPGGHAPPPLPIRTCTKYDSDSCQGDAADGTKVTYEAATCLDLGYPEEIYTRVTRTSGESTGWVTNSTTTLNSVDTNQYKVTVSDTGMKYIISGEPSGPTCGAVCKSCTLEIPY